LIQNTKCECGHQNPVGTTLCENCGKPQYEEESTELLEMRYDGVARRSQKENPSLIDLVWRFFSSVRNAIILIAITTGLSALGTIYPQENTFLGIDPAEYYEGNYGVIGKWYYLLGFSDTFSTWWFKVLLLMIGASLVICSLDRVLPLYRALNKQQIRKHLSFLTRQKVVFQGELPGDLYSGESNSESSDNRFIQDMVPLLKKKGYRVHTDGSALLAEKHRFSRWGPYINHIGLIITLLALLLRSVPGWYMDQYIGFLEGEPTPIPDTPYYLMNEQFTVEYYTEEELPTEFQGEGRIVPSLFETKAVLYECTANCDPHSSDPVLTEVHRQNIIVNKPLNYKGLLAYQFDFRQTPQIRAIDVYLTNKSTSEEYGPISLSTINPEEQYEAGPYQLSLRDYYPEFDLNDRGEPITVSRSPLAPAYIFLMQGPGISDEGEIFIYFPREVDKERFSQDKLNGDLASEFTIGAQSMEDVSISQFTSYLNIRIDRALPYVLIGGIIFIIGVAMGIYWQHRRIWLRIDDGNRITIGAHTNKNWHGVRNDLADVLTKAGIKVDQKQLNNGGRLN
jgi:cytochrome c biogenesis protein